MKSDNYSLQMPFIDQSENFAYGFECGKIWSLLTSNEEIDELVNYENYLQIESICKHFGYDYSIEVINKDWLRLIGKI